MLYATSLKYSPYLIRLPGGERSPITTKLSNMVDVPVSLEKIRVVCPICGGEFCLRQVLLKDDDKEGSIVAEKRTK